MTHNIEADFRLSLGDFTLDAQFAVPAHGVSVLFGPSGCGKTTLLRAIAGLQHCPQGYLKVADQVWQQEAKTIPPHQRPLGFVFQEASLFSHFNVLQNVEYGYKRVAPAQRRVSLQQAIELLDLADLLDRKPDSLSGGERQRVAIARAVALSPRLLLMDEPLAALDQKRKQELLPYIRVLHRQLDVPILYISHSLQEVAQIADYLVLMEAGRVLDSGVVDELFTRIDLPLAHELDASSIIHASVQGFDERYNLMQLDFGAGSITVAKQALQIGDEVRLRLVARDVSLTLQHQSGTSILNIFAATVDAIVEESPAQVTVRLLAGKVPILSRITHKSAAELGLKPGKRVYAQVKSVALLC